MKNTQNIYDNDAFFEGYMKLRENPDNMNINLVNPAFFSLAPDLTGKVVLDLGCGYGENCAKFLCLGAEKVVGIDISEKMLDIAKAETNGIEYILADMNNLSDITGKYDVVFSSMAVHYVEDFNKLCAQVANLLIEGGYFIFSQEHPFNTSPMNGPSWSRDENGKRTHYNLSDYGRLGKREMTWFVDGVIKYHRRFSDLINSLIDNGFFIEKVLEPLPSEEVLAKLPSYAKEFDKQNFMLIRGRKI